MFDAFSRPRRPAHIDLASVRDTLLYIESDLNQSAAHSRLASAIRGALAEIDRIELSAGQFEAPQFEPAQFVPARL